MEKERRLIPNRLKMHRKRSELSQKQVVKKLGLYSSAALSDWEHGKVLPSTINLIKLSILYRTYPNELYHEFFQEVKVVLDQGEL